MHSLLFLLTTIILSGLIAIPPCFSQNDQYATCGDSFKCGSFENISYPFWGGNRPEYCGNSSFQLNNCQDDVPLITIQSISYRVLLLEEPNRSLTLARADLWNDTCPTLFFNTTLDSPPFTSLPTNQILAVDYGCTLLPGQLTPIQIQFNCPVSGTQTSTTSYFGLDTGTSPINSIANCTNSIRVPVNGTSGQALASTQISISTLETALASGFGVQWTTWNENLCNQCQGSGGRCGSNTGSNSFACYCADGVFDTSCNTTAQNGTCH